MRVFRRTFFSGLVLLALLFGGLYLYLARSLPTTEGELALAGLHAPVEVVRDAFGVPHLFARSADDAYFALGFVHAQDRLWQMEMSRRIASGRLAEIVGPGGLETDRFLRTLGVRRAAEANLAHYDEATRRALDAYARGVNAFLATDPVLPPEFLLLGVRPERWTPADSVAWTKMMAWDLGGNWRSELLRLRLARALPSARLQELLPPYPGDAPVELPDLRHFYGDLERAAAQLAQLQPPGQEEGAGSNSWVIAGERSASGKPLLANDPHLGLTAPAAWYLAHLSAPGMELIGATLPGVPGVLLGRNRRLAWGFTNTGPDVQDLYLEKIDAAGNYLTPEGPRAFQVFEEEIRIKGRPSERLRVRVSRHGPVISDVSRTALEATPRGHALALAWTALAEDDLTLQSALKIAQAADWDGFLAAARDLHAPQQNVTYADIEGNIGFIAAGRVPRRKRDNDLKGLAPAPGWQARYDWDGYVPFDELPRSFNPANGALISANHKIVPPGYAHHITSEWQPPYRARRIEMLLEQSAKHDLASFARMQGDTLSLAARELLPHLLATVPRSDEAKRALALLASWDGSFSSGRAEPLIVTAWWRELTRALYADELGAAFEGNWSARAPFLLNVLGNQGGQARWCDNVRTAAIEDCAELLASSLEAALAELKQRYGSEIERWSWGAPHAARHRHRPLTREPWLAKLFDISVPSAGGNYTLNVGRMDFNDAAEPFANRHAASLRALYDLADPERSLFIQSTGQSGNPLSAHYRDLAAAWAKIEYLPMLTERARIEAGPVQRLLLAARK